MSKKQFKDIFEEAAVPASVKVVDKSATGAVTVDADAAIVNGSASKAALYGNGNAFTAMGYAGSGSVKSVAGVEVGKGAAASDVTVAGNLTAKVVAGAKYEFSKEEAKNPLTGADTQAVALGSTKVTVLDAKVTDAFAGAVMTDTATSKKFTDKYSVVVDNAEVNVVGGTVTNVYGGGTGALSHVKEANIYISGGKVTNVYAGGLDGAVVGDANIFVDMNSGAAASAMSIGTIYAGGKNANLFGDVKVTVTTNGAVGSNGSIKNIVGTPAGKGVVYGTRELYLDAYQGDFAATVKNMDKVVIASDSAVTFTKGQDKSMKNAEYVLEVSEADNSNQAAILTLKSDYQLNKLTVSVDSALITDGGSFSRTLIAGVKGKFNSTTFDADKVNIAKTNGNLIADYQYELAFETTTDKKGNEVETGKLVFTYTGADLKVSVDGYTNRYGVANVLSSADDVVTFGYKYDAILNNYDRVLGFDFKTMAGDDEVVIEDGTYLSGKLSLGDGKDTLTVNGYLSKLDLAGGVEGSNVNTIIVNGTVDARNIKTSDSSANIFVVNSADAFKQINVTPVVGADASIVKNVYLYEDGSTTVDKIDPKKKVVTVTTTVEVVDALTGDVTTTTTTTPYVDSVVVVDKLVTGADQTIAAAGAAQDLTLLKGDNTVVVNNAFGIGDITLGGKAATVVLSDAAYGMEIDLRNAAESTLIIDANMTGGFKFTGSRRGESNIVIAESNNALKPYSLDQLDLKYGKANLKIEDAVTLNLTGDFTDAGLSLDDVEFGFNSAMNYTGGAATGALSGHKEITGNLDVMGDIVASEVIQTNGDMVVKGVVRGDSYVEINATDTAADFQGGVEDSEIAVNATNDATVNFGGDVLNGDVTVAATHDATVNFVGDDAIVVDGTVNVAAGNDATVNFTGDVAFDAKLTITDGADVNLNDANVTFGKAIDGDVNMSLTESTVTIKEGVTVDVNDLTINDKESAVEGEGTLNVNGSLSLSNIEDFKFNAAQKVTFAKNGDLTLDNSEVTVAADYDMAANEVNATNGSELSGEVKTAEDGSEVKTTITADVNVDGTSTIKDIAVNGNLDLDIDATLAGEIEAANVTTAGNVNLLDGANVKFGEVVDGTFTVDYKRDEEGNVILDEEGNQIAGDVVVSGEFVGSDLDAATTFTGGNIVVADGEIMSVDSELVLDNVNSLTGDVRVYGYDSIDEKHKATVTGDIALDGNFETDIDIVTDDAEIKLSADTLIGKEDVDVYGAMNVTAANATVIGEVAEGSKATVNNGISAADDLAVQGNIKADVTVADTLTMGVAGVEDDYVTKEDDTKAPISASIEGKVVADDVVADADAAIVGELDANNVAVATDATLTVDSFGIKDNTTFGQVDYEGTLVIKGGLAVAVENDVKINNASLTFASDMTVSVEGNAITMDALVSNSVELAKDQVLAQTLNFTSAGYDSDFDEKADTAADNTLYVNGSASANIKFNETVEFGQNLSIIFKTTLDEEDNPYAKFDSDVTMTAGDDYLYVGNDYINDYIDMKNIDFKGGENTLEVASGDTLKATVVSTGNLTVDGVVEGSVSVTGKLATDYYDATITGTVTAGEIAVDDSTLWIDNAAALTVSKLTLTNDGQVGLRVSVYDEDGIFDHYDKVSFSGDLTVAADDDYNTIDANIAGKLTVTEILDEEGNSLGDARVALNGTAKSADLTKATYFGGNATLTDGATFSSIRIDANSDITGNFTAAAGKAMQEVNVSGDLGGQFGANVKEVEGNLSHDMIMYNDSAINGTVTLGAGADDVISLGGNATIADIVFGTSNFGNAEVEVAGNEELFTDVLAGDFETVSVSFDENLELEGNIARGDYLDDIVDDANDQFIARFEGDAVLPEAGDGKYTVTVAGKDYTVSFQYNGGETPDYNNDFTVTVEGVDTDTIKGSDAANTLAITGATTVDGNINLAGGDDKLLLGANLTLNALTMDGFILYYNKDNGGKEYDNDSIDVTFADSNVFKFGAGNDTLVFGANAVTLTAAKVLFDTLTVSAANAVTGGTVAANLEGNVLNINTTVEMGDVKAATINANSSFTAGDIDADTINATADFTAEKISGGAVINLNRTFTYKDEEAPALDSVTDSGAIAANVQLGNGIVTINSNVTVVNEANVDIAAAEDLAAAAAQNTIAAITGATELIDEVDTKVSSLVLNDNSSAIAGATTNVNAAAGLVVAGDISNLVSLTTTGNVTANAIIDVDNINVAGTLTADVTGFDAMTVAANAKVNGDITGDAGSNRLVLNADSTVGDIDFAAVGVNGTDKLTIGKDVTLGSVTFGAATGVPGDGEVAGKSILEVTDAATANVTFGGNGIIQGAGTLTGAVSFAGSLTLGAAVTGTITGTGLADDVLTVTKQGATVAVAGIEDIMLDLAQGAQWAAGDVLATFTGITSSEDLDLSGLKDANATMFANGSAISFKIKADAEFASISIDAAFAAAYDLTVNPYDAINGEYTISIAAKA